MPAHGFYNANEERDYPFVYKGYRPEDGGSLGAGSELPRRALVDFYCLFGPDARFYNEHNESVRHVVYLHEIRRESGFYEFDFRVNVSPTDQYALIFVVTHDAPEWTSLYTEAIRVDEPDSSDGYECPGFVWEGCLVVGVLADLGLADGESIGFGAQEWQVEPALVQTTSYLQSVSLANYDRTKAYDQCETTDYDPPRDVLPFAQCLTGPLRLREGHNCAIRQDDTTNTITIAAVVGGGAGQPCEEILLHVDEESPDGGKLLSGGPACDEIIATINGLGGRHIRLRPGLGVTIERDPDDAHGLLVTIDLTAFNACLADDEDSSVSDASEGA